MASGLFCWLVLMTCIVYSVAQYKPNWKSLDSRPLPAWYDQAKIGIFMHWGVYSVPSFGSEWFWFYWQGQKSEKYINFMKRNYPPGFTYADFAPMFKAEFFNPLKWADILQASGAKYVVLTSKHHEGFTMWPSKVSWNWNAYDVGPKRDLVGELAAAIRNQTQLHFGLYHSLFEWFHPLYLQDKKNNFTTQKFVMDKTLPELYEIVNAYKPDVVWSDGNAGPDWYWNSTEFLAWLYNESPVRSTVVTNDRWGNNGIMCKHGGYYTCTDHYNPGVVQKHKWENCLPMDRFSWGYRRNQKASDIMTIEELITEIASTVSCGGNILINVGPTHDGRIIPLFEERLRQMGSWLNVNGEAIYSSVPWIHQNDTVTPGVWYTSKVKENDAVSVYAIVLKWAGNQILLGAPKATSSTKVTMLGYPSMLKYVQKSQGLVIQIPSIPPNKMPCQWAWVLKLENIN